MKYSRYAHKRILFPIGIIVAVMIFSAGASVGREKTEEESDTQRIKTYLDYGSIYGTIITIWIKIN